MVKTKMKSLFIELGLSLFCDAWSNAFGVINFTSIYDK